MLNFKIFFVIILTYIPITERKITEKVENALNFFVGILADPNCPDCLVIDKKALAGEFNLNPQEVALVTAALGLIFNALVFKPREQGLSEKNKRRIIQQAFVDNPPGSRQQWEEEHGKDHIPKGRFPTGRNYSGRRKARIF